MTREEQRVIRELKEPLIQACKEAGKRRGWKTVSGSQYFDRGGILYMLRVSLPPVCGGRAVSAWLSCKPLALDEMFWEVFHMAEEAAKMPFSFHVNGAFTAPVLTLGRWEEPLPAPEDLECVLETVFSRAETLAAEHPFPTPAEFRQAVEREPANSHRTLNIILCLLYEREYVQAMEEIGVALAQREDGGFLRMNGKRGILEDAREWCASRLGSGKEEGR